jgi:hypothetical protein
MRLAALPQKAMRIVASISYKQRMKMAPETRPEVKALLEGFTSVEGYEVAEKGFGWEQIELWAPLLSPYINRLDDLIGMTFEAIPRFIVLGSVWRIAQHEKRVK